MGDPKNLENLLNDHWNSFQRGDLTKGDIVSIYLLLLHQIFPTPHWLIWNDKRKHTQQSLNSLFCPKLSPAWTNHLLLGKIPPTHSMGQIMNQSVFKKETLRTSLGLMHIFTNPETVKIVDYIPTPLQVLEMQAEGNRCVTLLRDRSWFHHEFDHKRNLRDFIIHDLEHIWQMFEVPFLTLKQIQFSKKLLELTRNGHFNSLIADAIFKPEFDYIISDMNTHPSHTFATLKALLIRHELAACGTPKAVLSASQEEKIAFQLKPFEPYVV